MQTNNIPNSEKVKQFMVIFNQHINNIPKFPSEEVCLLRLALIKEEYQELLNAHEKLDIVEVADAITDLLYVVYGMAHAYGIPIDECFEEVHRSNMSKLGPDGKPIYRKDGKVVKGPLFSPPDLKKILQK